MQQTKLDIHRSSLKSPLGEQQRIKIYLSIPTGMDKSFLPLFHNTTSHSQYTVGYIYSISKGPRLFCSLILMV